MISTAMTKALNIQATREYFAAWLYRSMGLWCDEAGLHGAATWMKTQAGEEIEHAERFITYIEDQGGHVEIGALEKPLRKFASLDDVFAKALEHERKVTKWINELYTLALEEKDVATQIMLNWYITEQIEEEQQTQEVLTRLELYGKAPCQLMRIDHELGKRKED